MSATWPKTAEVYVHGSKENMWDIGTELGLDGEALNLFRYALYEVAIEISVNRDGAYKVLSIKD